MPRHPDPQLEERILRAAQKLWKKGGEEGLTMRAVAKTAGTNTPAVYRRFRDRQQILRALLRRLQQDLGEILRPCQSPTEVCQRYLDYALSHPHEYELFYEQAYQMPRPARPGRASSIGEVRPNLALMEHKLAEWLGGSAADHSRLALSLWIAAHGAAMILISKAVPEEHVVEMRAAFFATVETLIGNAAGSAPRVSTPTT
jgi:AcrR family transcriptional regulator